MGQTVRFRRSFHGDYTVHCNHRPNFNNPYYLNDQVQNPHANTSSPPRKWISHQLSLGTTIICDRYYYSGMVYSAAKKNPSLPLSWTKHPEVGLPRPDAVIFLDLDPEEAAKRGGYGDEKYETQTMQKNVRELFMQLKEEGAEMVVVDAGKSVEKVHERIMQELGDVLGAVARGEMGREVRRVGPW